MTCFIAQNELSAFADDALEMARAAELRAHLSGCSGCTRELQEIRRVRTMLRGLPVHRAPVDFLAKVKAKAQRKSFLERAGAALEPLLRLPRPAQAGLALAASLVIAVTVFINPATKRGSVWDSASAPGAAISLSEVANVQATPASTNDFAKRTNLDANDLDVAGGEKNQPEDQKAEGFALADESRKLDNVAAQTVAPAPPSVPGDLRQDLARGPDASEKALRIGSNAVTPAPAATSTPAFAFREEKPMGTPAPVSRAFGGAAGGSPTGATGSGASSYTPPTNPGLYSSTPQAVAAVATPRPKVEMKAVAGSPNKLPAKEVTTENDREPAYDSSLAAPEPVTADSAPSGGDFGSASTKGAGAGDPFASEEALAKSGARDSKDKDASGKKEARRDRVTLKASEAAPASAAGRGQMNGDDTGAPAEAETVVATGAVAAPAVEKPAATVSAKYLSAASSAPQDVVAAAQAAGGKLVSPSSTPPGLGKVGASTVVIVEIPASGVAAFEEKLRLGGTFERGSLPNGAVRYRIEVVRQ